MTVPSMTTEEALRVLRAASPNLDMQADDARSLMRPIMALASHEPSDIVNSVGEALFTHEMESLIWQPLEAAELILVLVDRGSPSRNMMELALSHLSMYFQELDDVVEECRSRVQAGESLSDISAALSFALHQLDGVGPIDRDS